MRKILISFAIIAFLNGCSSTNIDSDSWSLFGGSIPRSLENLPFIYRPTVVQGNVIAQEMVDKLKLGMDRKQVEFAMGTPLLRDIFHDNQWNYYYGIGIGHIELEKYVTLEFEDDKLVQISGDYTPQPEKQGEGVSEPQPSVITVPDWEPPKRTLYQKIKSTMGLEEEQKPVVTQ